MDVLLYQDEQATRPFALWFDSLDVQEARKVQAAIDQLAGENLSEVKSVGACSATIWMRGLRRSG